MQSRIIDKKELFKRVPLLNSIDLSLCVDCKAVKKLCGYHRCPLLDALDVIPKESPQIEGIEKDSVFGPVPQIFVGSNGYPTVSSGPLTSLHLDTKIASLASNPAEWVDLDIPDIISLRFGMLRGKKRLPVRRQNVSSKFYGQLSELTLSVRPVDTESRYITKPLLTPKFDYETQPMGPSGVLATMDITSNPKIPKKVDRIIDDELKAQQQMVQLYNENFDVYYLNNVLSSGVTGLKENSRLVPTRWSITATDDMIGKHIIESLRFLPTISDIELFEGNLLGNYFSVILIPGNWSFENFETWVPGGIFTLANMSQRTSLSSEGFSRKEYYKGRTSYSKQAGGYYATRLAVLEHLKQRNRQARVVVIREISPEYAIPVGVWAVREGMRLTLNRVPQKFAHKDELRQYLYAKLMRNADYYFNTAQTFIQSSLDQFF